MNNDISKNDDLEIFYLDEAEKENLELLTDELIQVLNLDNIDKSSDEQKEELMQRVLKLGGDKYTFEDVQTIEDKTITGQGDVLDLGRTWSTQDLADNIHVSA